MRAIIIEDNPETAECLAAALHGMYATDCAASIAASKLLIQKNEYDLALIDLSLPDGNGLTICTQLRQLFPSSAIVMISATDTPEEKVRLLDAGADDYVTKPFHLGELLARLRALIRRPRADTNPVLQIADLSLNPVTRLVSRHEGTITLRRKEFDILEFLMRNPDTTLSRAKILEHIWQDAGNSLPNTVDVHIKNIRDKVDRTHAVKLIHTVSGIGYVLRRPKPLRREVGL